MSEKKVTKMAFSIVFLCFLLSTFMSLWSLHLMVVQNKQALSKSLAAQIYDTISKELSEPTTVARTMAQDRFLISILEMENAGEEVTDLMADYLTGPKEGLGYGTAFVISDHSKRYYSYSGLEKTLDLENDSRDAWYRLFVNQNQAYALDVDRDEMNSDAFTVFVNARVESQDGHFLGVCGVGRDMTQTQELFGDLEEEYSVKINLIDQTGLVQVDTNESQIEHAYLKGLHLVKNGYGYERKGWDGFVITKYVERLGWYLVITSNGNGHMYSILQLLILNIIAYLLLMVIISYAIHIIAAKTEALAFVSLRDNMTSLYNRRAFEEEKLRLSKGPLEENLCCLTADLNGLKTTNDNLGHAAGDELIQAGASVLSACLGSYGRIYRIGGEEFAAILVLSEEELKAALQKLEESCKTWRGEKAKELSISVGYALRGDFPSENVSELMRTADEHMYQAKEAYYQAKGIERRK